MVFSGLPQTNEGRLKNEGAAGYFEKSRLMEEAATGQKELIQLIEDIVQKSRDAGQGGANHFCTLLDRTDLRRVGLGPRTGLFLDASCFACTYSRNPLIISISRTLTERISKEVAETKIAATRNT